MELEHTTQKVHCMKCQSSLSNEKKKCDICSCAFVLNGGVLLVYCSNMDNPLYVCSC